MKHLYLILCLIAVASSAWSEGSVSTLQTVYALEPFIYYEDAYTETRLDSPDPASNPLIIAAAKNQSLEALQTQGVRVTQFDELTSEQKAQLESIADRLKKQSQDLLKEWKDKTIYTTDFDEIKKVTQANGLLVHFIKIKVGSPGSWDFMFTGAVTPNTSTTIVKSGLIDFHTKKCVWANQAIERSLPNADVLQKVFRSVYSNISQPKK